MNPIKNKIINAVNERQIASFFLFSYLIYIISFGIFISHGFVTSFNWGYLYVLIPIFLIDVLKTLTDTFSEGKFFGGKEDTSKITVIIPSHNGGQLIGQVIKQLLERFSAQQIIVSSNGSTDNTVKIAQNLGVRVVNISEPIGKVAAINVALSLVETPYTLIMDDDTFVGNQPLPTSLLDKGYEALAFRVFPKIGNWITKIQSYEYRKCMDINKKAQNKNGCVENVSGAIGIFRTKELERQISLHSSEFSGEDLQRSLLIHLNRRNKGIVVTSSVIETDVPDNIFTLYRQRVFGWYPGFYSNILNFIKIICLKKTPFLLRYSCFYNLVLVMGLDIFRLISFPVFIFHPWIVPIYYFSYVLIESITYFRLGSNDPYWIILIYPFYGLFNFIVRMAAFAVFCYRRLVVLLSRLPKFDDYKKAPLKQKISSIIAVNTVTTATLFLLVFYQNPHLIKYFQPMPISSETIETSIKHPPAPVINSMTITAESGDSLWRVSGKALNQYLDKKQINVEYVNKNRTIYNLTILKAGQKVRPSTQTVFTFEEIDSSLVLK